MEEMDLDANEIGCARISVMAGNILVCAVLTLIATAMMKDYTGKDIEGEYE
jgi:hypothetical protein